MTEIELNVLRHLYLNPIEGNFTVSVLQNALGMEKAVLETTLQSLKNNGYLEFTYDEGQKERNDPSHKITGLGAKTINELDGKGIKAVIAKYGTIISLIVGIIGAFGVAAKTYFDNRVDVRGDEQLKIQRQQLQIQQQTLQRMLQDTIPPQNKKTSIDTSVLKIKIVK